MYWISGKCYGEKQSRRTGWEVEGLDGMPHWEGEFEQRHGGMSVVGGEHSRQEEQALDGGDLLFQRSGGEDGRLARVA